MTLKGNPPCFVKNLENLYQLCFSMALRALYLLSNALEREKQSGQ